MADRTGAALPHKAVGGEVMIVAWTARNGTIMARRNKLHYKMSPRVELARRILETLTLGQLVSTLDAMQLRNWAVSPEESVLTLEEVAYGILGQGEGSMADAARVYKWRRNCAEFIMTDLEVAFTFLDVSPTSGIAETGRRNQKNARTAYDAILRLLPRSLDAFSAAEQKDMESKLGELKRLLEELGENFHKN